MESFKAIRTTGKIEPSGNMICYAQEKERLRIFMKGLLHLDIFKCNYQGLQSFIDTMHFKDGANCYSIEIYQCEKLPIIELGYKDRDHWERILKIIEGWVNKI